MLPIPVYISHAIEDNEWEEKLRKQLFILEKLKIIKVEDTKSILGGDDIEVAIEKAINQASIILLLLSDDFLIDNFDTELPKALSIYNMGKAKVLLVLLRNCLWEADTRLSELPLIPENGIPVVSEAWDSDDVPYTLISKVLHRLSVEINKSMEPRVVTASSAATVPIIAPVIIARIESEEHPAIEAEHEESNEGNEHIEPVSEESNESNEHIEPVSEESTKGNGHIEMVDEESNQGDEPDDTGKTDSPWTPALDTPPLSKNDYLNAYNLNVIDTNIFPANEARNTLKVEIKNNKFGIRNTLTNKVIIPFKYSSLDNFSESLAFAKLGKLGGYINKKNKIVINFEYSAGMCFKNGIALVKKGGKWGWINKKNVPVINFDYDNAYNFNYDMAIVKKDGKWGWINKKNEWILPPQFDACSDFENGVACVSKDDKWGFIDVSGKVIVNLQYNYADNFKEGLALVEKDNKWGFIDINGTEIIPLIYEQAQWFTNGKAMVVLNGTSMLINNPLQ